MRLNPSRHCARSPASQQGIVLFVGLVMVVLLTLIGLAAIRGSGLQESMAFNMRDKTVAFQAAESGLRACETHIVRTKQFVTSCIENSGICDDLNLSFTNSLSNSVNNNPTYWLARARDLDTIEIAQSVLNTALPHVDSQPRCLIEVIQPDIVQCNFLMGNNAQIGASSPNCRDPYRVTAKGVGAEPSTEIILQTTYTK